MKKVCISIQALYEKFGEFLKYSHIKYTPPENEGTGYYDLYNDYNNLSCCDGENVSIISITRSAYGLINVEGERNYIFALSPEEFEVATFK